MQTPKPALDRHVTLASAQIVCLDGDRAGNLVRIENAIREARAQGADLVAFPESCLFGWVNPDAHQRATPIPGADSDILCALARKYQVHLCIGLDEKDGDRLYGAAILVDDAGRILLKHRKNDVLAHLMTPPYTPGTGVSVADTRLGRIGVLICADSFHKPLLEQMRDQRPDYVLVPYGWAAPEAQWPGHGLELRKTVDYAARTIGCPVIGTDLVGMITHGPWTGQVYGGQSVAADGQGTILFVARDRDRDLTLLKLPLP